MFFVCLFVLAELCGMWDLSSLTKDQTCAPVLDTLSLNLWTTREVYKSYASEI